MKVISRQFFATHFIFITALLFSAVASGQSLPEGPGRDKMLVACTVCHGLDNITNPHKKLTAEEWEFYLYEMVARGAPLHTDDFEPVKRYLIENFAAR